MLIISKRTRAYGGTTGSKLAFPSPVNLPSQRKEHSGNDPTTQLVPSGSAGPGWSKPEEVVPPPPQPEYKQSALTSGSTWASQPRSSSAPVNWHPPQKEAVNIPQPQGARGSYPVDRHLNPEEYPSLAATVRPSAQLQSKPARQPYDQQDVRTWADDERAPSSAPFRPGSEWGARDQDRFEDERFVGEKPADYAFRGGFYGYKDRPPTRYEMEPAYLPPKSTSVDDEYDFMRGRTYSQESYRALPPPPPPPTKAGFPPPPPRERLSETERFSRSSGEKDGPHKYSFDDLPPVPHTRSVPGRQSSGPEDKSDDDDPERAAFYAELEKIQADMDKKPKGEERERDIEARPVSPPFEDSQSSGSREEPGGLERDAEQPPAPEAAQPPPPPPPKPAQATAPQSQVQPQAGQSAGAGLVPLRVAREHDEEELRKSQERAKERARKMAEEIERRNKIVAEAQAKAEAEARAAAAAASAAMAGGPVLKAGSLPSSHSANDDSNAATWEEAAENELSGISRHEEEEDEPVPPQPMQDPAGAHGEQMLGSLSNAPVRAAALGNAAHQDDPVVDPEHAADPKPWQQPASFMHSIIFGDFDEAQEEIGKTTTPEVTFGASDTIWGQLLSGPAAAPQPQGKYAPRLRDDPIVPPPPPPPRGNHLISSVTQDAEVPPPREISHESWRLEVGAEFGPEGRADDRGSRGGRGLRGRGARGRGGRLENLPPEPPAGRASGRGPRAEAASSDDGSGRGRGRAGLRERPPRGRGRDPAARSVYAKAEDAVAAALGEKPMSGSGSYLEGGATGGEQVVSETSSVEGGFIEVKSKRSQRQTRDSPPATVRGPRAERPSGRPGSGRPPSGSGGGAGGLGDDGAGLPPLGDPATAMKPSGVPQNLPPIIATSPPQNIPMRGEHDGLRSNASSSSGAYAWGANIAKDVASVAIDEALGAEAMNLPASLDPTPPNGGANMMAQAFERSIGPRKDGPGPPGPKDVTGQPPETPDDVLGNGIPPLPSDLSVEVGPAPPKPTGGLSFPGVQGPTNPMPQPVRPLQVLFPMGQDDSGAANMWAQPPPLGTFGQHPAPGMAPHKFMEGFYTPVMFPPGSLAMSNAGGNSTAPAIPPAPGSLMLPQFGQFAQQFGPPFAPPAQLGGLGPPGYNQFGQQPFIPTGKQPDWSTGVSPIGLPTQSNPLGAPGMPRPGGLDLSAMGPPFAMQGNPGVDKPPGPFPMASSPLMMAPGGLPQLIPGPFPPASGHLVPGSNALPPPPMNLGPGKGPGGPGPMAVALGQGPPGPMGKALPDDVYPDVAPPPAKTNDNRGHKVQHPPPPPPPADGAPGKGDHGAPDHRGGPGGRSGPGRHNSSGRSSGGRGRGRGGYDRGGERMGERMGDGAGDAPPAPRGQGGGQDHHRSHSRNSNPSPHPRKEEGGGGGGGNTLTRSSSLEGRGGGGGRGRGGGRGDGGPPRGGGSGRAGRAPPPNVKMMYVPKGPLVESQGA